MTQLMTPNRRRRPLTTLFDEMFEDFLAPLHGAGSSRSGVPAMNVAETSDAFVLAFELPGVEEKDISVQLDGDQLVLSAERRFTKQEGVDLHRVEHRYGSFARSVTLPKDVKSDEIQAKLEKGVLTVTVPKAEPSRARRIEIQSS